MLNSLGPPCEKLPQLPFVLQPPKNKQSNHFHTWTSKMAKIMDPILPILSMLGYWASILGSFGGPGKDQQRKPVKFEALHWLRETLPSSERCHINSQRHQVCQNRGVAPSLPLGINPWRLARNEGMPWGDSIARIIYRLL